MLHFSYQTEKKLYMSALVLLMLFLIFLASYHFFDWELAYQLPGSCIMHDFMHLYCPGCGGTRAVDAFLHGKVLQSVLYHPVVVYIVLGLGYYYLFGGYTFFLKRNGKVYYRFSFWWLYGMVFVILAYWIGRNILLVKFHIDFLNDLIKYW